MESSEISQTIYLHFSDKLEYAGYKEDVYDSTLK